MKQAKIYDASYWMVPWREYLDHPEIMRRLAKRVRAELQSNELAEATSKVAICPELVVDDELPPGIQKVSRMRNPPAHRVAVVIPYQQLVVADARTGMVLMIDAWKIALAECFRCVKLSPAESERLLKKIDEIAIDPGDILPSD